MNPEYYNAFANDINAKREKKKLMETCVYVYECEGLKFAI